MSRSRKRRPIPTSAIPTQPSTIPAVASPSPPSVGSRSSSSLAFRPNTTARIDGTTGKTNEPGDAEDEGRDRVAARPLSRVLDGHVADATAASSVASAISRTTSTMSRLALKTRSWRWAPLSVVEDVVDALELGLRAELAGVRLELPQPSPDELRDRNAVAAACLEVHQWSLEPVPGGQPLVLAGQDPVVRPDLLAAVVALAVVLDERLAVGRERDGVLDARDRVADSSPRRCRAAGAA